MIARRRTPTTTRILLALAGVAGAGLVVGVPDRGTGVSATAVASGASGMPVVERVPVVWVQAGHQPPGEPGYRAQTGAGSGPFGGEVGFTTRVAEVVVTRLRAAGVDARRTPALVTPWGARGAAFVSIHHDAAGGHAAVGHAIAGANENWYRGEGEGAPRARPYPDSAAHRPATTVSRRVEGHSRSLAATVAARFRAVFTSANGARGAFTGVEPRTGNVRMMRFYGYYRTRTAARILIECGAPGVDDAFLRRTDTVGGAISAGIVDHLRARGLLNER